MHNEIDDRVKNIISAVLEVPGEDINGNSSPDTIKSWDSLKHMNLVVALEEEFKIEFTEDEIPELMSYNLIKSMITEKIT